MKTVFELIEANGLTLHGDIEHFAELVRAEEREACAVIGDSMDPLQDGAIGRAIRAKGASMSKEVMTDDKGRPLKFWGGKANEALDKKAENARELGLDYEPIQCPICKAEDSPYPKCGCVTYVEQPAQEPVAWMHPANPTCVTTDPTAYSRGIPLYTSPPPQRTWVWLTDEERRHINRSTMSLPIEDVLSAFATAIEAKSKEKNT